MPVNDPFPLDISVKQDSWEKLQLLANVDPSFKVIAEEFNTMLQALNWLRENIGGEAATPSTTPAEELIYFGAGAIALTSGANTQGTELAAHINTIGFTITAGRSVMISAYVKRTINGQVKSVEKRYRFRKNNLEGTHGTGSTHGAIIYTDLIENGYERIIGTLNENDQYIDLDDIGSATIQAYINALDPETVSWENLADDGTEYYFTCVRNGDSQTYKYTGNLPIILGSGNTAVDGTDFDLVASSSEPVNNTVPEEKLSFTNNNASGAVTIDFNTYGHADVNFTANGSLTFTPPTLGDNRYDDVGLYVTGNFTITEDGTLNVTNTVGERDQTQRAFYAIRYWKAGSTLKFRCNISNTPLTV
ncbi:hypothetical protein [Sediminibacter sp. Hel_I_10]|uniref:hypothetical protein n=1 Tax=Sediminibacter sp. Hel_I_10 TaxID=1392490 RepID=UPI00047EB8DF|nr:hypothetical protein [Sediminibacter sp. Hel_I_10]